MATSGCAPDVVNGYKLFYIVRNGMIFLIRNINDLKVT